MTSTVADTSVLVAAVDTRDRNHSVCADLIRERASAGIIVPATVAVEVDHLLRSRVSTRAARTFIADLNAGRYILEPVDSQMFAAASELDLQYADLDLGIVDGTVVAVARRWQVEAILSLDGHYHTVAAPLPVLPEAPSVG